MTMPLITTAAETATATERAKPLLLRRHVNQLLEEISRGIHAQQELGKQEFVFRIPRVDDVLTGEDLRLLSQATPSVLDKVLTVLGFDVELVHDAQDIQISWARAKDVDFKRLLDKSKSGLEYTGEAIAILNDIGVKRRQEGLTEISGFQFEKTLTPDQRTTLGIL